MPRLTYFSSRGLAELTRLLLSDAGVAWEAVSLGAWNPADQPAAFRALQASGRLPFNAVPLWEEDDGTVVVQSDAIVRHIARTRDRCGDSPAATARADMIHEAVKDVRAELRRLHGQPDDARPAIRERLQTAVLPRWIVHFSALLQPGPFTGPVFTWADLSLWLLLEALQDNGFTGWQADPALAAFDAAVQARPGVAAHIHSPARFPVQRL